MKRPQFSVIIPVYNRAASITRCLLSVLNQTYAPQEIIVVDDGSTDETKNSLKTFQANIRILSLPSNQGVSKARNTGIRASQAPWIALLDSDDEWKSDKLEKDQQFITQHPSFKLFQSIEIWYRHGKRVTPKKYHRQPEGWIYEKCLKRCLISPSGVVFKKELVDTFGYFDESLPACEDYDFWLRLTRHLPCGLVPHATVIKYGGHKDQLSKKYPAMDRFRIQSLKKLLATEKNPAYFQMTQEELRRRERIYLQGAKKRVFSLVC